MAANWKLEDTASSVQAQMHEIERILLRAVIAGRVSGDTKRKVSAMLKDIDERFAALPEQN